MDALTDQSFKTAAKTRQRPSFKRLALVALAGAAVIGTSWYGYDWWTAGRFIETTDDAYVGGNVTAMSPHVAGFVAQILVADNQYVHAGQTADPARRPRYAPRSTMPRQSSRDGLRRSPACEAKYVLQQTMIRQAEADLDGQDGPRRVSPARTPSATHLALTTSARGRTPSGHRRSIEQAQARPSPRKPGSPPPSSNWPYSTPRSPKPRRRRPGQGRSRNRSASISAIPRSARRSTAMSATAPRRSAPMSTSGAYLAHRRPGARTLGRRQFQGRPTGADAAGPDGDGSRRCAPGQNLPRPRPKPGARRPGRSSA